MEDRVYQADVVSISGALKRSTLAPLIALAVLATACSSILGETPVNPSPGGSEDTESTAGETTSTPPANECVRFTGDHSVTIDTGAIASDALSLSGEMFLCANEAVVVPEGDLNQVAAAAQLAAAIEGPLLFPEPRLASELGRLKVDTVHLVGSPEVNVPNSADTVEHDIVSAVDTARERLGTAETRPLPAVADAATVVETVIAIEEGDSVIAPQAAAPSSTTLPPADLDEAAIVAGLAEPTDSSALWLVDAAKPETILLASAAGKPIGASVVAIDGTDILGYPEVGAALQGHSNDTIRFVGAAPAASDWELAVLTNGQQVPGGGFTVLPDEGLRRYLAYYGHPGTDDLGVLGEQGPAETRSRMQDHIDAYAGDGAQVIPTYEIIVSVASAGAGEDGDYSTEWPPETFDEWISYAGANDMYVLLDLQSGREDFLSQAMIYEDLLKLPFVGLALDPEWRLQDDQVHLVQTGTVDAAEINQVVAWLGDLVRDNGLPQKMLVLHQFKSSMITNRGEIMGRPELQLVLQMDGDGTEPQKNATWALLKEGAADAPWAWGWKNFFDEDEPGPPTPESTMSKDPTPIYVSYQ